MVAAVSQPPGPTGGGAAHVPPPPRLQVFYGGTFDPVHNGHLQIARAVRDALEAPVWLLPAADPPHKHAPHADADQRACMLELALAGEPGLEVDRRELLRAGPSYTVDTLGELRAQSGPRAPIVWLIGSDSLHELHTWHRWRELFTHAHVLAVERPGSPVGAGPSALGPTAAAGVPGAQRRGVKGSRAEEPEAGEVYREIVPRWRPAQQLAHSPSGGFAVLPLPGLRPESSTRLRALIGAGGPWQDWVPVAVANYIRRHRLYACRAAPSSQL